MQTLKNKMLQQGPRSSGWVQRYVDNILVGSQTVEEHLKVLERVFEVLRMHGWVVNPNKCQWLQPVVKFLGSIISEEGIVPGAGMLMKLTGFNQGTGWS